MTNVTFTSPKLNKDITVHATAGDHSTLLAVAREHVIPLDCECDNGEYCSCAVQVSVLKHKAQLRTSLIEKAKAALRRAGKMKADQSAAAGANATPWSWRMACQFIVRDEDVLVRF